MQFQRGDPVTLAKKHVGKDDELLMIAANNIVGRVVDASESVQGMQVSVAFMVGYPTIDCDAEILKHAQEEVMMIGDDEATIGTVICIRSNPTVTHWIAGYEPHCGTMGFFFLKLYDFCKLYFKFC